MNSNSAHLIAEFYLLSKYRGISAAQIRTYTIPARLTRYDVAPDDTAVGRTGASASRLVVVAYTLDAFIGIHVVAILAAWVIAIVHDRIYRTLVDA